MIPVPLRARAEEVRMTLEGRRTLRKEENDFGSAIFEILSSGLPKTVA
jgi:hypothetical protein